MKKLMIVLMILCAFGCTKQKQPQEIVPDTTPEFTVEPTPTPEPSKDDVVVDFGEDTEIIEDVVVKDDVLEASFMEETEVNPTTLTFYKDTTVKTNLNVCSGMAALTGNYEKQDDMITITFFGTGYDFLDGIPFTFNLVEDKLQLDAASDMFSCAGVDSYVLRKADEE